MIIYTAGLEGCGHHGLEPIFKKVVSTYTSYYARKELEKICKRCCSTQNYDLLAKECETFFAKNKEGVFYQDCSYPHGHNKNKRNVEDQWKISKLYNVFSQHQDTRIIHLKRNMFNTVNSHPNWDGGIINHAKKLHEINKFIESELSILRSNNVEVVEINYEDIPTEKGSKIISSLLSVNENLVKQTIDKTFKLSTKDYKTILDPKVINELDLIFNSK